MVNMGELIYNISVLTGISFGIYKLIKYAKKKQLERLEHYAKNPPKKLDIHEQLKIIIGLLQIIAYLLFMIFLFTVIKR